MQSSDGLDKIRVIRHLPATLINSWAANPNQEPIWEEWLPGSLMHCDVTGFTAMNESLSRMGREGAEVMARILNEFFETMLGIAQEWGGIQMKFGGDAMLLYFREEGHAHCAARCGLNMQAAMKPFGKLLINEETYCLRMRIGIHSGDFFTASVGQENGLLHYFLSGQDVNLAADVEPKANPDQVVISEQTATLIGNESKLRRTAHDGIWEVKDVLAQPREMSPIDIADLPYDVLQHYLMPPLIEDSASIGNEHRRVTVIFIYLQGFSKLLAAKGDGEALRQANLYMNLVFESATRHGGYLSASDASEHGDKLIVLFGAPKSLGNHEPSALLFSQELNEKLKNANLDLQHQIGINTGFVFAGEIGSSWRREYTTIGDNVNLAARLMGAAGEGNILISSSTAERLPRHFKLLELEPIMVKGKSKPIPIFRFEGVSQEAADYSEDEIPLIGRESEMSELMQVAAQVKQGNMRWRFVHGEPGIGKSRLISDFLKYLSNESWMTMMGICQSYNLHNPFSAWIYPLRKLLGISGIKDSDAAEKISTYFQQNMKELADFAPLIADILSVDYPENAIVMSLDPKTRREKRIYVLKEMILAASAQQSLCVFLDNVHWADSSSMEALSEIASLDTSAILIVLASRENELPAQVATANGGDSFKLLCLSDQASRDLLEKRISLTEEQYKAVIERAKGNPLFLEELSQNAGVAQGEMPESVYDLIVSRLDHLEASKKVLLKNAAVIGQIFDQDTLFEMTYRDA